ncbi:transcription-repair coupling factor [Porcipelethomonas sp.]|uniref:transcription-repair coupling factor n=1 Tax=Porcipelethomonas sp. TaxID=2981675 RepID=UPI003EF8D02C
MNFFRDTFRELESWKEISACLDKGITPLCATGLSHVHKAQFIYSLYSGQPVLVITESEAAAKKLCDDLEIMSGQHDFAMLFPSRELALTRIEGFSREYEHQRLAALSMLINGKCKILAASIEAVMEPVIPEDVLIDNTVEIKSGGEINLDVLKQKLVNMGYVRCDKVEGPSQFSVRGAIADIFPVQSEQPVRMELWGDEIDSISYFDPETQRRTESAESVEIAPAIETVTDRIALADKIDAFAKGIRSKKADVIKEHLAEDADALRENSELQYMDKYIPLIYDGKIPSVFEYFSGITVFSEYVSALESAKGVIAQYNEDCKILLEEGELCRGLEGHYFEPEHIFSESGSNGQIFLSNFVQGLDRVGYKKIISFDALHNAPWGGEMRQLNEDLKSYCDRGYRTMLIAGSEKTLPIIRQDLTDAGIKCDIAKEDSECLPGRVLLMTGSLSGGTEYPENKTAVITQAKATSSKKKKRKHKKGEEIRSLSDISAGDLVVHSLHGIGRFVGIRKLELEGVTKDYITIQYAGKDVLYVPVTQLDMVSRYIGPRDDTGVKLNKLSSAEWQKTRNNVKRAVKDMAHELTALYAKRENSQGIAFEPDDEMQRDFESRFPYAETDDQLQSISEIKEDMEKPRPMDRLLCGDVGFGKTEVAFRAAMKCVASGKQCAILVPTTVLAMQHYQTALRRFEQFPVNIELLSRFRTPKQQQDILKRLKKGLIDIIIGTHRLVQKDVEFKDLGLAIIDEEQRFGVAHKEKFKEHFTGVDMLTLSATPIPRTLNMAMSGIRDMSVIDEPPQDRHPVQTYVVEYNPGMLIQAINKELKRGGQVYYIHNRVETIAACASKLQDFIPDARIAYAHGQMSEEDMSEIWRQLVEHEIDILVCTTIIETGVDVPNVNTLIIEDADYFGLSQLYQLRGRVGRSNRRAFAYFTFRREKVLSEVAAKRLNAMREFTQFGSGFRIAMRDLEIRGAGSILGGKQHGHMESVGYDMYIRLLTEAIAEEKGEPVKKAADCSVDIQIDAHIPEKYIESLAQRLDIYKKIAAVETPEDKVEMIDELIDRYGDPPKSVLGLIDASLLRNTAANLGITEIKQNRDRLFFYIEHPAPEQINAVSAAYKGRVMFNSLSKPYISIKLNDREDPERLMESVLSVMKNNCEEK